MAIKFNKPEISIQELENIVSNLEYDNLCLDKLFEYQKEYFKHYAAITMTLPQELNSKNFMSLSKYEELHDKLKLAKENNSILTKEEFVSAKHKLILIIKDLITLIVDNNIEDKSINDIDFNFGS